MKGYFVYMLRCRDGSLYTGYTTEPERREKEHLSGINTHANYTRSHPVEGMAALFRAEEKHDALSLEYRIKHLKKEQKEALISGRVTVTELFPAISCKRVALHSAGTENGFE